MSVLFILIIVSIIVAASFLGAFIWSVKSGQYEDDYTPSVRMLFDDELIKKENKYLIKTKNNVRKS
ncbi:MAG: cbb3-type cytochrome oxidase assembly protein CcoS [Vicingaceae bacterium]